ncbi:CPBP family intramembrane glutamic endopeptidase [Halobacterium zhouii]|uniref:CPBP family intramembrane glutamic endopeptidase n=1 Tax=Halobacterium zhouii TaxID=2902624 RepID=UPI001E5A7CED|nr:CPBP family intramembrane glutamic endopeptidase [Halobacterium zhouii]
MEPRWTLFAGAVALLTVGLVALARASAALAGDDVRAMTTGELLANVVVTQGGFGVLVVAAVWLTRIPLDALGVTTATSTVAVAGAGLTIGVVLYAANEGFARVLDAAGLGYDEAMRDALSPDSLGGWAALLAVALPLVAGFEELLFRGALVGALSVGFGVSPWLLAAVSSVAFGLAHSAQGGVGVLLATLLGFALAAVFVLTDSLLAVILAHYVVNALEFAVHGR